jgi:N-acetylmuramoyl-L-alanine amidase
MPRSLLLALLLILAPALHAAQVTGVRLWTAPDHTRLVFDASAPAEHKVFTLKDPDRLVIDFPAASVADGFGRTAVTDKHLAGLRHAARPDGSLRVVLDLRQPVRPKSFGLKPGGEFGHRVVVDLYPVNQTGDQRVAKTATDIQRPREVVIAIDAGHGGEDPGAIGRRHRTLEKDVTLEIARRLKRVIDAEPGMRAVLTRTGDYFIGLRKRMALAREHRADLFVSIHADAFHDRRVRGSSVYVLSRRGASSEAARWLAERENNADLVGGVSLEDKDDLLASVLLDLSQSATQHASLGAASHIYGELGRVGKVHGRQVHQAAFMVLKSPDVPSVLVETGFISNPDDERNLRDADHQERLARAVAAGLRRYFTESPPPGTLLAERARSPVKHVISRGDTLSEIASRYQVSLTDLRRQNAIRSDNHIRIGQVLVIPGS